MPRLMDKSEAAALRDEGGRMRSREAHTQPLPWSSLAEVHLEEFKQAFEWTTEGEDAFVLLLMKGYSIRQITSQGAGWPTYADYVKKAGTDPSFQQLVEKSCSKRAESLVDKALACAENSRAATVQADRLLVDISFRTAAALDPERFGTKAQVGISGGLILAAGSLADLAAQAALLHTIPKRLDTPSIREALPSPDNVGAQDEG